MVKRRKPGVRTRTGYSARGWSGLVLALWFTLGMTTQAQGQAEHVHASPPNAAPENRVRTELGTSVAIAPDGTWHAVSKQGDHVVLYRSPDDGVHWEAAAIVNREPEVIAADGENRPKLAFTADGAVLVSWARRFEQRFTGDVRFARSADGKRFDEPITVHRDRSQIGHSFNSLLTLDDGRLLVVWLDARDRKAAEQEQRDYRGSALYAALSDDGGRSFRPEVKVADHSCQCCRIAVIRDTDGLPLLLWRHVYEPNERDHALAKLRPDATPAWVRRATFDGWKIDACPHHGPALAVAEDGQRHAVWFNHVGGEGKVFYGRLGTEGVEGQQTIGGPLAAHADLAITGARLGIAWKEFDGERTQLQAMLSDDAGRTFRTVTLAATGGASDQPRVLARGERLFVFWRTEREGMRGYPLP